MPRISSASAMRTKPRLSLMAVSSSSSVVLARMATLLSTNLVGPSPISPNSVFATHHDIDVSGVVQVRPCLLVLVSRPSRTTLSLRMRVSSTTTSQRSHAWRSRSVSRLSWIAEKLLSLSPARGKHWL